jgi:hypothetical protein
MSIWDECGRVHMMEHMALTACACLLAIGTLQVLRGASGQDYRATIQGGIFRYAAGFERGGVNASFPNVKPASLNTERIESRNVATTTWLKTPITVILRTLTDKGTRRIHVMNPVRSIPTWLIEAQEFRR